MKLSHTIAAALLVLPTISSAAMADTVFKGQYTVHYFSGPTHTETNAMCAFFKHTGDVDGFPDSGTWHAKTPEGVQKGNFIVDTGILRFYGTFSKNLHATNNYATVATGVGGFDVWDVSAIPVTPEQDGTIQIQKGC